MSKRELLIGGSLLAYLFIVAWFFGNNNYFGGLALLFLLLYIWHETQKKYTDKKSQEVKSENDNALVEIAVYMDEVIKSKEVKEIYEVYFSNSKNPNDYKQFQEELLAPYQKDYCAERVEFIACSNILFKNISPQKSRLLFHSIPLNITKARLKMYNGKVGAANLVSPGDISLEIVVINGILRLRVGPFGLGLSPEKSNTRYKAYSDICSFPLYGFGAVNGLHPIYLNESISANSINSNDDLIEMKEFQALLKDYNEVYYADHNHFRAASVMQERLESLAKEEIKNNSFKIEGDSNSFRSHFMTIFLDSASYLDEERRGLMSNYRDMGA